MTISVLDQICNHLQVLGYKTSTKVVKDDKVIMVTHHHGRHFALRELNDGLLFTTIFHSSDFAQKDREGYLNFINAMNQDITVARIYTDYDADLMFEAWLPYNYEETSFNKFLELWNFDTAEQLLEKALEAKKYLI